MIKWITFTLLLLLLFLLRKALLPLIIGLVIAYVLAPYVNWLNRKLKINRLFCILTAYFTVFLFLFLLILGFANIVSGNLRNESILGALQALKTYYVQNQEILAEYTGNRFDAAKIADLLQHMGSGALKGFIGLIIGIYLLKDKDYFLRLGNQALHLFLDQKSHGIIREICFEINEVISSFLRGVFIDSVIVAFLSSLALTLLQVNFALFIGCFAGIANIIPYFGPIIGMVPAVITAFADGGIMKSLMAAGSLFLIQQLECNLIYPRIIGKSTGLHPLFVLVTVSIAGYCGGLFSMILAVPFASILRVFICKWAYTK